MPQQCPTRASRRQKAHGWRALFAFALGVMPACTTSEAPTVSPAKERAVAAAAPTAQCAPILPDFTSSTPPPDFPGSLPASGTQLATFAWQHFVALNWASSYAANGKRGTPDTSASFFGQPGSAQPQMTVWQSYRHKNELFPATGAPAASFDAAPAYVYDNVTGPCDGGNYNPNEFTNLDENSQLGLDYMFAQPLGYLPGDLAQILFQAKVNKANYDYIVTNQLYTMANQTTYQARNKANLATYGAICQQNQPQACAQTVSSSPTAGYCLPCGGAGSEGTIHVKSAWRALTNTEVQSGRFFMAPVVIYGQNKPPAPPGVCYTNGGGQTYGLVGLHIIHKTVKFPAFIFATWEQVDNPTSNLKFSNTQYGGPAATVGQVTNWARVANQGSTLPSSAVQTVNGCVQSAIQQANSSSVWQYYQLVGVQGTPVDYANVVSDLPDFFLANNTIESNLFFQSFLGDQGFYTGMGTGPAGTTLGTNLTYQGKGYNMGGCQGCHGNAQKGGADMSFLSAGGANTAEAIGDFTTISARVGFYLGITPDAPAKQR